MIRSVLLIGFIVLRILYANAINWDENHSNLRTVYKNKLGKEKFELLKLYYDQTFEKVIYSEVDAAAYIEERSLGKYTLTSKNVTLSGEEDEINLKFFIGKNGKLYASKLESVLQKNDQLFSKVNRTNFQEPFYIHPYSKKIISNADFANHVDLTSFFKYQTKHSLDDLERFEILLSFIQNRIQLSDDVADTDTVVAQILFGSENKVSANFLLNLIQNSCEYINVKTAIIDGLFKSDSYNSPIGHQWIAAISNEAYYLFDPILGDNWSNVDPRNLIYTHFPMNDAYQFLSDPISLEEFILLPVLIPTRLESQNISFLPKQKSIEVDGQFQVLLETIPNEIVIISRKESQELPITAYNKVSSGGKTLLTIPISDFEQEIILELNHDLEIHYAVINNGKQNSIISDYYLNNKIRTSNYTRNLRPDGKKYNIENLKSTNQSTIDWYKFISATPQEFSHLLIQKALEYYGEKDIPGEKSNPTVLKFFRETGHRKIDSDETSWCSVFISYCVKELNGKYPSAATARSWLNFGKKVTSPKPGDIVIFWRESKSSWKGHVGIFLAFTEDKKEVITLGGNQEDEVKILAYPISQVLGYRNIPINVNKK